MDTRALDAVYSKYMEWVSNRNESGLSIRALTDRARYWKFLSPVYGQILSNAILPEHLLPYFHKRASKVSAKKELKFLSVIFNWARSRGCMKVPNPCAGLFVQMKFKESRDIYVEDTWLALVC